MTSTRISLSARTWVTLVVIGFIGQLAWTVENMYLNVFVYQTISTDPTVIAALVAASAIAATVATLLIGALSDRTGRRKPFIVIGYVLWGLTTACFGLVQPSADAVLSAQVVATAVGTIILLDCIMTVFGSGANDAAFNAWVTDVTAPSNRGRVDGTLAVLPLISMLFVFGALDPLTQAGQWTLFFAIIGGSTVLAGIAAAFLVRDAPQVRPSTEGYLRSLVHGLRPSTVRAHPALYVTFAASALLGTSSQVFLPYLIIYIQEYLRIDGYAIILGTVLILAAVISIIGGRVIDRVGKVTSIIPATTIMIAGLVAMFFARGMVPVIIAGTVMMGGFMLVSAAIAATVRDLTPVDRVGMVQGLRMTALVLIPMVAGPFIGASVIVGAGETYLDLGVEKQVPTPAIFLAAAVVAVFVVIPALWLRSRRAVATA